MFLKKILLWHKQAQSYHLFMKREKTNLTNLTGLSG